MFDPDQVPSLDSDAVLRFVRLGDTSHTLLTWDTYRTDSYGKSILGYAFWEDQGPHATDDTPLFAGEDFHCSPMDAIDSDASLRSILTFLTLRPGDTDRDYFDDYTARQLDWAKSSACEYASLWAMEDLTDGPEPFVDLIPRDE